MSKTVLACTTTVSETPWTVERALLVFPASRWSILEGVLYMAATPYSPHPEVVDNLDDILGPWVRRHRLGRVLPAQTGLYLNEINYLDPDLVFVRREEMPRQRGEHYRKAALAVEVLSPSNERSPRATREERFCELGVEEIWYVDIEKRTLEVRRLAGEAYETARSFSGDDLVTTEVLPGLKFPLAAAWEEIPE